MPHKVPDFELRRARAHRFMRGLDRNLEEIDRVFRERFMNSSPLDFVSILASSKGFGVAIFFKKDADIAECEDNGISKQMRDFIYKELEERGRGKRDEIEVAFEFDSFENVQKNFEGSYFLRLR
jgi:hypothetical protein